MIELVIVMFLGGMLTFLAPCTLPVLPAWLAFAAQKSDHGSAVARTLCFGLGLGLVFVLLGVFAGTLGALVAQHKGIITTASGVLLLLLGVLVLLGRSVPGFMIEARPQQTLAGSFVFGIIFALSWSGCIGPILGTALILAANTQTALGGGFLLLVFAAGLVFPLLLFALFMDKQPKDSKVWRLLKGRMVSIGSWKVHSTQLLTGFLLIILGIIFLFRIDLLLSQSSLIGNIFELESQISAWLGVDA